MSVLVLGDAFYSNCPSVSQLTDMSEINTVLKNLLERKSNNSRLSIEKFLQKCGKILRRESSIILSLIMSEFSQNQSKRLWLKATQKLTGSSANFDHDLVSIVMPAWQAENYIADAIASVLEQSYHNWELFIVDDCSTDTTADIAMGFKRSDDRIHLVKQKINGGPRSSPKCCFDLRKRPMGCFPGL